MCLVRLVPTAYHGAGIVEVLSEEMGGAQCGSWPSTLVGQQNSLES